MKTPLPPEWQAQVDEFAERLKTMSPIERSELVKNLCGKVNEASFDLLAAHKMQKSPIECLQAAHTTLTQPVQSKTIN